MKIKFLWFWSILATLTVFALVYFLKVQQARKENLQTDTISPIDSTRTIDSLDTSDDLPSDIHAFFACFALNWNKETGEREPWNGYVIIRGRKFSCRKCWDGTDGEDLGTLNPGETKSVSVIVKTDSMLTSKYERMRTIGSGQSKAAPDSCKILFRMK